MSFSPREVAADLYQVCRSMGTRKVFGITADDMTQVNDERRQLIDRAIAAVDRAHGTPRIILAEPSDADLDAMRDRLLRRRDQLCSVLKRA
jgi:hypothetical protein